VIFREHVALCSAGVAARPFAAFFRVALGRETYNTYNTYNIYNTDNIDNIGNSYNISTSTTELDVLALSESEEPGY
jgi:hypothetical protein